MQVYYYTQFKLLVFIHGNLMIFKDIYISINVVNN